MRQREAHSSVQLFGQPSRSSGCTRVRTPEWDSAMLALIVERWRRGMPTFMLSHWTRDRTRGERLSSGLFLGKQRRQRGPRFPRPGGFERGVLADVTSSTTTNFPWEPPSWSGIFQLEVVARFSVRRATSRPCVGEGDRGEREPIRGTTRTLGPRASECPLEWDPQPNP